MEDVELLKSMNKAELDSLPYSVYKWNCCCKECSNGTTVRDYGIGPVYFLNRNSKRSEAHPEEYWYDLDKTIWYCGKHWKYYRRLGSEVMENKYIDWRKPRLGEFIKKVNTGIHKIG